MKPKISTTCMRVWNRSSVRVFAFCGNFTNSGVSQRTLIIRDSSNFVLYSMWAVIDASLSASFKHLKISISFRWNCRTEPRLSVTTTLFYTVKLCCVNSIACEAGAKSLGRGRGRETRKENGILFPNPPLLLQFVPQGVSLPFQR